MTEPRAASFHGDQIRVGSPPRADPDPEDPAAIAAIREAERIVQEAHRCRAGLCRVGPNVLGIRPVRP